VNNQILHVPPLTDDDLYLVEKIGNLLYGHNAKLRGRNRRNNTNIPQTIYVTVPPKYKNTFQKVIMQGATHDKSRMRTGRRSRRPKPILSFDMGVAFTANVIPNRSFVVTLLQDIARSAQLDFSQSLELRNDVVESILQRKDDIERLPIENGVVRQFERDKFGTIWSEDRLSNVFFYWSQVRLDDRDSLKIGDVVVFRLRETDIGFQALEVEISEPGQRIPETGQRIFGFVSVVFLERRYGFIQILDDGPAVFFHFSDLEDPVTDKLQVGDYVEFNLHPNIHKGKHGRVARKITARE
jgi:cold shock CspA family protein